MKYILPTLGFAAAVAAHGYVDNATIANKVYTFYQPYQDPYTSPVPQRISRPIQGNGPITDLTIADVQCGGYSEGGKVGSSPAALHAEVAAGSEISLRWTLWPDSHVGPLITYMARCPDAGCDKYMPDSTCVLPPPPPPPPHHSHSTRSRLMYTVPSGSKSKKKAAKARLTLGAPARS